MQNTTKWEIMQTQRIELITRHPSISKCTATQSGEVKSTGNHSPVLQIEWDYNQSKYSEV
jgi:hypothetical protein